MTHFVLHRAPFRPLCLLVLHQVLLLGQHAIRYLLPSTPLPILQAGAQRRTEARAAHMHRRLLLHSQSLHASSMSGTASAEEGGAFEALRQGASSVLHTPMKVADTISSALLPNSDSNHTSNTNPNPSTSATPHLHDTHIAHNTDPAPSNTKEANIARLLVQQTTTLYAFNPLSCTLLTILPALLHQLRVNTWLYFPLAVLYFSYIQAAKDRNDRKLAMGIVSDPQLIKFG